MPYHSLLLKIYPTKKKRNSKIFPLSSTFNAKMLIVIQLLASDPILPQLKRGVDEYLCLPCTLTRNIIAIGKYVWGVYSMILSTWNFDYALALQSMKTIYFHYLRHPVSLFMLFAFPKSIFISQNS